MVGQSSKDNVSAKYSIFLSVNSISTSPFVFECGKIKAHNSRQGGETFTLVRILMKKNSCNNNFTCSYIYFKLTCTADSHVSPSQGLALETFVHNGNFVQNPFFPVVGKISSCGTLTILCASIIHTAFHQ